MGWNLELYDDGSVSEESLKVFQQAGSAVRKLYPKKPKSGIGRYEPRASLSFAISANDSS